MSVVLQYAILRAILLQTHESIQSPSAFRLPYDQLRVFWLLWKIPKVSGWISRAQWQTCCILFNMGLVEMRNSDQWYIAVPQSGALYLAELKTQAIKAACSVLLADMSALFGFVLGSL